MGTRSPLLRDKHGMLSLKAPEEGLFLVLFSVPWFVGASFQQIPMLIELDNQLDE